MTQPTHLTTLETHSINVETFGEGSRRVVALHCALGRGSSWKGYGRAFADQIQLLAPDLPGHGKSGDWAEPGLMRFAARQIIDELAGEQSIDLVGHSYGGMIALEYATRFPQKVRTLTLIEPIYLALAGVDNRPLLDLYLEQMQPHFDALAAGDHREAAALFLNVWGGGTRLDDLPPPAQTALARQIPVVDACKPGDEKGVEEAETLERMKALSMPIRLLWGENTLAVVKEIMQGLEQRLPQAIACEVSGAGHMLPLTHSDQIMAHLADIWGLET